jgi:uncharacterized protein
MSDGEPQVEEPVVMEEPVVIDVPTAHRYEIRVGGELAGVVTYQRRTGPLVLVHTEIDPRFEGHGLGTKLAGAVLDEVRRRGGTVVPRCPFVAGWIRRHPEYLDVVDPAARELVAEEGAVG